MIKDIVAKIHPQMVLDVGCKHGAFTKKLAEYCGKITAIDISCDAIDQARRENISDNISYFCMNALDLRFPDEYFDLVYERISLHHIKKWRDVIDEMVRVSQKYILIEEPLEDPRSQEKKNTIEAQKLYLEIQQEVGYAHYPYVDTDAMENHLKGRGLKVETRIYRTDELTTFDEFFEYYESFVVKTERRSYWRDRLKALRNKFDGQELAINDIFFAYAEK
ncbi:MAG: methyltransferase domain-containing protein [candidate division Zixibacteria bacterium]|nr:methyltransferase domain-containing protein [candidate division Zixibacteria bacterium]